MNDDMKNAILEDRGPGRVTMMECLLCGLLRWSSTATKEPDDVVVERTEPIDCPRCQDVQRRSPEVFRWVVGITRRALEEMRVKP